MQVLAWPFLLQNYIWFCSKGKDHNPLVTPTYIHLKSPYPHLFAKAKDLIPENVNSNLDVHFEVSNNVNESRIW